MSAGSVPVRHVPCVRASILALYLFVLFFVPVARAYAQEPAAPQPVTEAQLKVAIDQLGNLDYNLRSGASRVVRRTPATQAVPALLQAVASHADGYVRYRALVLLTGFDDRRTRSVMEGALSSPNDRLRTVAYSYFAHNPDPAMVPRFMEALDREVAEFVRPMLIRALAAIGTEASVQPTLVREAGRGEDFFRSAVIEALGDYKAGYAVDALTSIAQRDGPLVDDAALALGKIGDGRALNVLTTLQREATPARVPFVAAAVCLLGVTCDVNEEYLVRTLTFAGQTTGFQEVLRGAAAGLGALAVSGRASALDALWRAGIPSRDPARAPIALAVATVALRNPPHMLANLERQASRDQAIDLLAEGFDMLEEDFEKERFFVLVRRSYWSAPEASPTRAFMQSLIGKLDF